MLYERRIWPSEEGMQLNNVQRQFGESTSVATEYCYSQQFQSPFSYPIAPLQSGVSRLEFSIQRSLQQFNLHSSISAGLQFPSPGIARLTMEGESAHGRPNSNRRQTPESNHSHDVDQAPS